MGIGSFTPGGSQFTHMRDTEAVVCTLYAAQRTKR